MNKGCFIPILVITASLGCGRPAPTPNYLPATTAGNSPATAPSQQKGKQLATTWCGSCHLVPDPALLNRTAWKVVFPQMGIRLGIRSHWGTDYTTAVNAPDLAIPQKPLLSDEDWQTIIDYYLNTSPMALNPQLRPVPIKAELPFFSLLTPQPSLFRKQVLGCMVRIDSSVKPARIFVADGPENKLFLLNNKLTILDSATTAGPVVDMIIEHGEVLICTIGKELGATGDHFGRINKMRVNSAGKMQLIDKPLVDSLARPVQVLAADLNGDGRKDFLLCEFGNINGELSWLENIGNNAFVKHTIRPMPGAIEAHLDYSANRTAPNLWVLFAQGDEGIFHFINDGKGHFQEKKVLAFPPIYGSSSFDLLDLNGDGHKDIIYTCGDNGDLTGVLKPYHGLYVFLNDGKDNYTQRYFYPINGCYKALVRDFDGDGQLDIATIALYTDKKQPREGFIFFKGLGGLHFQPYSFPPDVKLERAVTMEAGDLDGDGKPDLLIGNAFFDFGPFARNGREPLFFELNNKTRKL